MTPRLTVEPPMSEEESAALVTNEEVAAAAGFAPARRREYLAWRAVVRRETDIGAVIAYDDAGAPVVTNRPVHISVSHCPGRIAVLIADRRCAVDIEPLQRSLDRVIPRYMTPAEQALSKSPLLPVVVWCAKEALYKYAGRPALDLLRDLHIEEADLTGGRLTGRIADGEAIALTLRIVDGFAVVSIP